MVVCVGPCGYMVLTLTIMINPKGPCTQIVYTLAPKYLYRDYFKAKLCTIRVHGPLGKVPTQTPLQGKSLHCVGTWTPSSIGTLMEN